MSTATGNLTFSDNIPHFVSSFAQNASISLLSGNIEYGTSNTTGIAANNLENISTTCSSPTTVYIYNSTSLLLAYGVTLAVTVVLVIYGVALILQNGAEPSLSISSLIGMALNNDMLHTERQSGRQTEVQLFSAAYEQEKFVPVSKVQPPVGLSARRKFFSVRFPSKCGDLLSL